MKTSKKGIEFIKKHESFEPEIYLDAVNVATIGYGHAIRSFEMNRFRGVKLTEEEATALLEDDLRSREETVNNAIDIPLKQNQFDMLVSLVYNIGSGAFNSSTVKRRINNQESEGRIKEAWNWWTKGTVGGVKIDLPGLVKRRKQESEIYFNEANLAYQPKKKS